MVDVGRPWGDSDGRFAESRQLSAGERQHCASVALSCAKNTLWLIGMDLVCVRYNAALVEAGRRAGGW